MERTRRPGEWNQRTYLPKVRENRTSAMVEEVKDAITKEGCLTEQNDNSILAQSLENYTKTKGFQRDVEALAHSYKMQNMPVPSLEQLQSEAISEMRECLANMMAYRSAKHL